jgi:hypothetical protein
MAGNPSDLTRALIVAESWSRGLPLRADDSAVAFKARWAFKTSRRGDLFTAPTVIERHESLDPARQPMGCAAEPSRARAQVGAILGWKIASANHESSPSDESGIRCRLLIFFAFPARVGI